MVNNKSFFSFFSVAYETQNRLLICSARTEPAAFWWQLPASEWTWKQEGKILKNWNYPELLNFIKAATAKCKENKFDGGNQSEN